MNGLHTHTKQLEIIHAIEVITDLITTLSIPMPQETWTKHDKDRLLLLKEIEDRL